MALALAWLGLLLAVFPAANWNYPDWHRFMESAARAAQGVNPYPAIEGVNLNAPASLLLFRPFLFIGDGISLLLIRIADLLAFVVALQICGTLKGRYGAAMGLWLAVQGGMTVTIYEGQIYGILALLLAASWRISERRSLLAGLVLGLACAIKPNLGVIVLLLLATGRWRLPAMAVLCFAMINGAAAAIYGLDIFGQWAQAARMAAAMPGYFRFSTTLRPLATALGVQWLWQAGALTLIVLAVAACYRARPSNRAIIALGSCLSIVCSPVAWLGYNLMVLPLMAAEPDRRGLALLVSFCFLPFLPVVPMYPDIVTAYGLATGALYCLGMLASTVIAFQALKPVPYAQLTC